MGSLELPTNSNPTATALSIRIPPKPDAPPEAIPELKPRFRLSTLLLAVTSSAICLAVARHLPEIAVAMVFVMAIAMIRLLYGIQLHADYGVSLSFGKEIALYVVSILAVISIGGFVVLAFSVTLGACLGLSMLIAANTEVRQTEWIFGGFISGWILGVVAAAITGGWFSKAIWFANLSPKMVAAKIDQANHRSN
jgi:hypothetical protein